MSRSTAPRGRFASVLLALGSAVVGWPIARADVTPGDLQVMARALSFLEKPLSGEVSVGIVYQPGNAQSERDAATVQRILAGGLRVGGLTLTSVQVPLTDLPRANVGLLFLTAGIGDQAREITAISRARHLPCVTTDLNQVRDGVCAMGVRSAPKVEILANHQAALDSGVSFSTVFRMMITEL